MRLCELPTTEVGAGGQSKLGCHQLLASLPPPAVVFPQDLLEKGLEADNFAMLGLGDIVIPGDGAGVRGFPGLRSSTVKQTALPHGKGREEGDPASRPGLSPGLAEGIPPNMCSRAPFECQALSWAPGGKQ